jgi:polyphosphate kinase
VLDKVQEILRIDDEDLVPGGRYHNFMDFFQFPNPVGKHLEQAAPVPLPHLGLETQASFFEVIARQDVLLHFPYQSYDYVLQFFNTAAIDPLVKAIKVTVYRIAGNSFIANALISAARNGKKVTVFVEVKARFDEINNLKWAQEMKKAGVKIIYSIPGLKVHAKVALVTRREPQGNRHYAYMGTGNFNESTARFYADHGLLTANPALTHEIGAIFSYLKDQRKQPVFQHLLVAPMNLQPGLLGLIDREIANARNGLPAGLVLKLNSLEDEVMIEKLYEASEAGVPIHLIVRGICCLVPGIPGQSERIQVTRIVDFFLEHARIFVFHNQGDPQIFMGSADWMKRNLYHRVEVVFPVLSPALKNEVWACLALQLTDSQKAVWLDANLQNIRKQHGEMEESLAGWFPTETNSTDAIQTYPRGANPRGANPRRGNPRRAQFDFYHWLEAQSTQHE